MSFLGELWDNTAGGLLWKPIKKATGLSDAQLALLAAGVVTGGAALAAAPAAGAGAAAAGAGAAEAGAASAGLLGAESAGAVGSTLGGQAVTAAPVFEYSATAGSAPTMTQLAGANQSLPGAGFSMAKAGEYAKVGGSALQAAGAAKGLLAPQQHATVAQAQPRPLQLDAGLLSSNSQGITDEAMRRRQQINQFAQNAMGGGYGRTA